MQLSAIGDSGAVKIDGHVLFQHQAARTLLADRVSMPGVEQLSWLDLACGRGQILVDLDRSLSVEARGKVTYYAYDVDQDFVRETSQTAGQLGFADSQAKVGDLADFDLILPADARFDFITLTNTVHELAPGGLASLLVGAILRLSEQGVVFIYDMEQVKPPELGALPWARVDMRTLLLCLLEALGAPDYRPEVNHWPHRSVSGWSVQVHRDRLALSQEEISRRSAEATQRVQDEVVKILRRRLNECRASLKALEVHGSQTAEEQDEKVHLLHEHWALLSALGENE